MKTSYYDVASLQQEIAAFEARYELATDDLVKLRRAGRVPKKVPAFDAFVWVDLHHELERMVMTVCARRSASRRHRAALLPAG